MVGATAASKAGKMVASKAPMRAGRKGDFSQMENILVFSLYLMRPRNEVEEKKR